MCVSGFLPDVGVLNLPSLSVPAKILLVHQILDDDEDEDEGNNNSSSGRGDINSANGTSPDAGEEKGAKKRRKV